VPAPEADELDLPGLRAVAELYHRWLTGLLLAMVTEIGEDRTVEVVFGLFRRQHLERFLPGLRKLGLAAEPHAVACAKYHYLSNHVGGVGVVFVPESDRKAWVRYLPPRWVFDGTALAGIPTRVERAMLWGWHGHNGVSLGNPRLGFVCTGQTMDGMPGLEGYYVEEDRELAPEERVRFRLGEQCPPVDPAALPVLPADAWPADRLAKVERNYAMDYLRNLVPVMCELLGPLAASGLVYRTGRRIGMQYASAVAEPLGEPSPAPLLARLLAAHGDLVESDGDVVVQRTWRLVRGLEGECVPEWFDGWRGIFEGVLAVVDRDVALQVTRRLDLGEPCFQWEVRRRARPGPF
jgi:hypothetical protein